MIIIGICDDDPKFIDQLYNLLQEVLMPICDWKSNIYHNGAEVLDAISNGSFNCDLLFSDIYMDNMSGFELAKYIHEQDIDTDVIVVTSAKEYVFESFQYRIFAYLLKPINRSNVGREIRRYLEEQENTSDCLQISTRDSNYKIPINSILYIENYKRIVTVYTKKDSYSYYEKLNSLEQKLKPHGFFRCHQSYLIASDKIRSYQNNCVYLEGTDSPVPVSRQHQKEIRNLFDNPQAKDGNQHFPADYEANDSISHSLRRKQAESGALICVSGTYLGSIIRIKPEQRILIGRDGSVCDIVINLPMVSRSHCEIIYHRENNEYAIVDYSGNGTFINGTTRLVPNETYLLKPGTELCFGDQLTVYKLG